MDTGQNVSVDRDDSHVVYRSLVCAIRMSVSRQTLWRRTIGVFVGKHCIKRGEDEPSPGSSFAVIEHRVKTVESGNAEVESF